MIQIITIEFTRLTQEHSVTVAKRVFIRGGVGLNDLTSLHKA